MRRLVVLLLLGCAWGQDASALAQGLQHFKAASSHAEAGRFAEAVEELNVGLPHFQKAGDPTMLGLARMFRGFCNHRLGRYADALPDLEKAVELLSGRNEAEQEHAAAQNQLAVCLMRLGRGERALALLEEVLEVQRRRAGGKDLQALSKALNDTGFCLLALGRPTDALEMAKESVAMGRRLHPDGHPGLAAGLDNLASCYDDLGRFPEALVIREQALAMTRASHEGDHQQVAQSLGNLAYTLQYLGRADEALTRFTEARAVLERLHPGDHHEVATVRNNLAMCLGALGRWDQALPLQQETLAMERRLSSGDHPNVAMMLHNLGATHLELGQPKEALGSLDEALAMRLRLYDENHPDVALTMNDKAQCLKRMGRIDEAIALLRKALAIARRLDAASRHSHAANLGITLLQEGDRPAEAAPLFEEAIAQIEERRGAAMSLTALDRAAYLETLTQFRAYDGLVRAQLRVGRPDEALRALERGRARGLLELLERSRIDPLEEVRRRAEDVEDAEMLTALGELNAELQRSAIETGLLAQSLAAARTRTDLPRNHLRTLIAERTAELVAARKTRSEVLRRRARLIESGWEMARTVDAAGIQRLLAPEERMLVYSVNDLDGVVLLVPPPGKQIRGLELKAADGTPLDERKLLALVDGFRRAILDSRRKDGKDQEAVARHGHSLFRAVVPPSVWKAVSGVRRVYLVPHRALHRIPFEALVVEKGAEPKFWLDAGPEVAYVASGSALLWSRRRQKAQQAQASLTEAVALGDAIFSGGLAPLPGTRREADAMRRHLAPMRVVALLGRDATEARLFAAAPRARWLHLATHQIEARTAGSTYSGLALTAPEDPTPQDDGALRLLDLFENWRGQLDRCELVVLSACETHVGREFADEGVFALPWGFQFAGAPSVIASLWRVDDESTAELFGDFYRRLGEGEGLLHAFVEARRTLRKVKPQPYYWAPFIFIGAD
ncbi:MAG: CHAT domain-containing protein [Planctomycetota bacterium]|jgi:CHAT domain-containing protein/Tfp pilus assembly protein PilF